MQVNIIMRVKYMECENVDWIKLAQDNVKVQDLINAVKNFYFQYKTGNLFTSRSTVRYSTNILLR